MTIQDRNSGGSYGVIDQCMAGRKRTVALAATIDGNEQGLQ
jgi:hypothetical protein